MACRGQLEPVKLGTFNFLTNLFTCAIKTKKAEATENEKKLIDLSYMSAPV